MLRFIFELRHLCHIHSSLGNAAPGGQVVDIEMGLLVQADIAAGKIILMMLFCPHVFRHEDSSFLNASDPGGRRSAANSHGGETKYA